MEPTAQDRAELATAVLMKLARLAVTGATYGGLEEQMTDIVARVIKNTASRHDWELVRAFLA